MALKVGMEGGKLHKIYRLSRQYGSPEPAESSACGHKVDADRAFYKIVKVGWRRCSIITSNRDKPSVFSILLGARGVETWHKGKIANEIGRPIPSQSIRVHGQLADRPILLWAEHGVRLFGRQSLCGLLLCRLRVARRFVGPIGDGPVSCPPVAAKPSRSAGARRH
jgi:hypothetical protein